jgi:hypothetical protein
MWVIRNTVQLFYSWLLSFYLKYNCNYLSCYFKWRRRNFLNTVEYVLVLSGCPCLQFSWIHVSLSGLPLTKQATTGFGQHLEVAKGKFFVPARQNAVFPHFVSPPPFFFIQIQMKLNKHAWMLFLVSCVYCSDLFPGIWHQHDILLWNAFFNLSCILEHVFSISWYRVLRASFSNWSVTFFKSCLKVYK